MVEVDMKLEKKLASRGLSAKLNPRMADYLQREKLRRRKAKRLVSGHK
jgi:hypothetical protein